MRLCLERIVPPRRERLISFDLPALETGEDAIKAMSAIAHAVANGELTPGEAAAMTKQVDCFLRAIEVSNQQKRLKLMEETRSKEGGGLHFTIDEACSDCPLTSVRNTGSPEQAVHGRSVGDGAQADNGADHRRHSSQSGGGGEPQAPEESGDLSEQPNIANRVAGRSGSFREEDGFYMRR